METLLPCHAQLQVLRVVLQPDFVADPELDDLGVFLLLLQFELFELRIDLLCVSVGSAFGKRQGLEGSWLAQQTFLAFG